MQHFRRLHLQMLLVGLVLFMVGCGGSLTQTVTLYRDEAWQTSMEIRIAQEMLLFIGSAELEAEMAGQAAAWQEKGARVSWKSRNEEGAWVYTFDVKGEGYDLLREVAFDNNATLAVAEVNGRRQIQFWHNPNRGMFGDLDQYTLTLKGGEIISSNGRQLNSSSVEWVNPTGPMEATLTEKGGFPGAFWLVMLGVAIAGGSWYMWRQRGQTVGACGNCGAWLSTDAEFCPQCGRKRNR